MSFYVKDKNAQVYGDYIKRLGTIAKEYNGEYEVTLSIALLQSILITLKENVIYEVELKQGRKNKRGGDIFNNIVFAEKCEKKRILTSSVMQNEHFGFKKEFIIKNTLFEDPTYLDILTSLRNALAHPRKIIDEKFKSNGYSVEQKKEIERVVFVNKSIKRDDDKYIEFSMPVKNVYDMVIALCEFTSEFLESHDEPRKVIEKWAA